MHIIYSDIEVCTKLSLRYINELLVQWLELERRILVWLGPVKHKNAEIRDQTS